MWAEVARGLAEPSGASVVAGREMLEEQGVEVCGTLGEPGRDLPDEEF